MATNSGLHSKDRNVRAFVECSITAGVVVGTALALRYGGTSLSATVIRIILEDKGVNIPPIVGHPLGGFIAPEFPEALSHLAYEGAEAFGSIAWGCASDVGGILSGAANRLSGSGAIPL